MATIDELKRELEQLRAQNSSLHGDQLVENEAAIRRVQRELYEAGPHHAKWVRLRGHAQPHFITAIDTEKPVFEFVRMILTAALVVAVTIFFGHQVPTAVDGWFWAVIWSLAMLGLIGMCGILLFGTFNVAIHFAVPLAASIADQAQAPFNKGVAKFVAWCVVLE